MYRQSSLLPSSGVWYSILPVFSALLMRCSSLIVGHHRWLEGSFLGRLGLEDVLAVVLDMRLLCVFSPSCISVVAPSGIFKGSPLLREPVIFPVLLAHPTEEYKRTWVCMWHRRSWSVSKGVTDRWNGENGERSTRSNNDGVEDGRLLNGGPVEVLQRLLEEAWGGHCDLGLRRSVCVRFTCAEPRKNDRRRVKLVAS